MSTVGDINLAVVGADGMVGEAVLELLAQRGFDAARVHPVGEGDAVGQRPTFGGGRLKVADLEGFDFSNVAIAVFCPSGDCSAAQAQRAAASGCLVVDACGLFREDVDVPLVVAAVNADDLADVRSRGIVACPDSAAVQLALVLKPVQDAVGVERVDVAIYQSVSGLDRKGPEELARQTAQLLNGRPVDPQLFPRQIAFNALARGGVPLENGYTAEEMALMTDTRRVLGSSAPEINATVVRIPTFHGDGQVLHLRTRDKLSAGRAREVLEAAAGVTVVDGPGPEDFPTAVTDAVGADTVFVGRLREDISHPRGLDLWTVADNVRTGVALNSVQIVEILVKKYL